MNFLLRLAAPKDQFGQQLLRVFSTIRAILSKIFKSGNNFLHNNAITTDSRVSQSDKFLHYNEEEGYYKTSPFGQVTVLNIPLHKFLWRDYKKWENNTATICVVTGRQYTFAELRDASAALAVRLQAKFELGKGDVFAICLPNLPEYPCATMGAIEAGLTVTTINPFYTATEIARQLTSSNAKFIVCTTIGYPVIKEACKMANSNIPISCVRMESVNELPEGAIDFFDLIKTSDVDYSQLKVYDVSGEDIALLLYSSGTTGLPKGVMLTHNNITTNCQQIQATFHIDSSDTVAAVLPLFHSFGLVMSLISKLQQGAKLVTLPQFKPEYLIKALYEHRTTTLNFVPTIALFMINNPEVNLDTAPALRMVMCGAAPFGLQDIGRFKKKFPKTIFTQGFGMTEASPAIIVATSDNTRYASTGFLLGSSEGKIIPFDSEDQKGLGANEVGELCVRGPQVMLGYLNNEEATKKAFYPGRWLRTGDAAYYDEDGYFYITDRMKELIKVKGFQVAPAELEALLRDHPKVIDAAVFGIPHEINGEAPRALVVLRQGESATKEEIYNYVAERVAHYKKLEGEIIFTDKVPRNASGKILRTVLRKKYSI